MNRSDRRRAGRANRRATPAAAITRADAELLLANGDLTRAEQAYRLVVATDDTDLEARAALADVVARREAYDEAEAILDAMRREYPDDPRPLVGLGLVRRLQGRIDEAVAEFRRALRLDATNVVAVRGIGVCLLETDRTTEALTWLERAFEIEPTSLQTRAFLARAYGYVDRFDDAEEIFGRFVSSNPEEVPTPYICDYLMFLVNADATDRGGALIEELESRELGEVERVAFNTNRAFYAFNRGDLEAGWKAYRATWGPSRRPNRSFDVPRWQGEDLTHKRIVCWGEQGIGDDILMASAIPDLIARAGHVEIQPEPRLASLFTRSFPDATVVPHEKRVHADGPEHVDADFHTSMFDAASWLRPSYASFPENDPLLVPHPTRAAYWNDRIAALGSGLRVGLSWRSRLMTADRKRWYPPLDEWTEIFAVPGIVWINLQYDNPQGELLDIEERYGVKIHDFHDIDLMNDFDEVAALSSNLDVVVAPSNAVSQLTAAIGTETWELSMRGVEFYLGLDHDPWRRAKRLFLRPVDAPWGATLETVGDALRQRQTVTPSTPSN